MNLKDFNIELQNIAKQCFVNLHNSPVNIGVEAYMHQLDSENNLVPTNNIKLHILITENSIAQEFAIVLSDKFLLGKRIPPLFLLNSLPIFKLFDSPFLNTICNFLLGNIEITENETSSDPKSPTQDSLPS